MSTRPAGGRLRQTIEPVYNLLEISPIVDKTLEGAARVFNNTWLSRYPWPVRCVHDNGPEFKQDEFQDLLLMTGIKPVPITPFTPQANSPIKATHLAIGQVVLPCGGSFGGKSEL